MGHRAATSGPIGVLKPVRKWDAGRGVNPSPSTVVRHVDAGFDFLGATARKYRGKMLIKPSKNGVLSFLESVRKFIKETPRLQPPL